MASFFSTPTLRKFSRIGVAAGSVALLGGCAASGSMSKADKHYFVNVLKHLIHKRVCTT